LGFSLASIKKTWIQVEFLLHLNLSRTYFEAWRHLSPTSISGSLSNAAEINKKGKDNENDADIKG